MRREVCQAKAGMLSCVKTKAGTFGRPIWLFPLNPRPIGENRRLMPATCDTDGFAPSLLSLPTARPFHCKAAVAAEDRRVRIARAPRAAAGPGDLASPAARRSPSSRPVLV